MRVSVVMATYGEDYWRVLMHERAWLSVEDQGMHEITHGHFPKHTIAQARNEVAEGATGDWLCFLDADDELAPGYLEAMKRAHEQEGSAAGPLLLTPAVSQVRKGRAQSPVFYDRGIPLTDDNWMVVGTLVQRDLFMKVGGFEDYPHGFEDWSLWYKCWKAGAKIVKVKDAIYLQHINPRSKHRLGWRDRNWQTQTHKRIAAELAAWTP